MKKDIDLVGWLDGCPKETGYLTSSPICFYTFNHLLKMSN